MEKDCQVNIVSLEMNRDSESSLSNSLESVLTVESSRGDLDSKTDECGGWTNEKHNTYLDHLENSFVRKLYSLLGDETHRLSTKKRSHSEISSKFLFQKYPSVRLNPVNTIATPVQGNVLCNVEIENSGDKATKIYLGHQYPAQCTAEASGQNFREEEVEERGCYSGVSRKRRREANYDESSLNDQVVP